MDVNTAKALQDILIALKVKAPSIDELMGKGLPEHILRDAIDEIESGKDAIDWCDQYR